MTKYEDKLVKINFSYIRARSIKLNIIFDLNKHKSLKIVVCPQNSCNIPLKAPIEIGYRGHEGTSISWISEQVIVT